MSDCTSGSLNNTTNKLPTFHNYTNIAWAFSVETHFYDIEKTWDSEFNVNMGLIVFAFLIEVTDRDLDWNVYDFVNPQSYWGFVQIICQSFFSSRRTLIDHKKKVIHGTAALLGIFCNSHSNLIWNCVLAISRLPINMLTMKYMFVWCHL